MKGWAVYIKPRSGRGPTLYAYTIFNCETGAEAVETLKQLGIPALWSDLFDALALPVLRVSSAPGEHL